MKERIRKRELKGRIQYRRTVLQRPPDVDGMRGEELLPPVPVVVKARVFQVVVGARGHPFAVFKGGPVDAHHLHDRISGVRQRGK